jgi:hypothetical protein
MQRVMAPSMRSAIEGTAGGGRRTRFNGALFSIAFAGMNASVYK